MTITPWTLAKSGTEHGEQTALFAYLAKAQAIGFGPAMQPEAYTREFGIPADPAIPELKWLHAIPNGGNRGDTERSRMIEGGKMKAEGVKSGVLDIFWPLPVREPSLPFGNVEPQRILLCGLYIEMKKRTLQKEGDPHHGCSDAQREFGQFVTNHGFDAYVCYTWQQAARGIEAHYNAFLKGKS